MIYKIYGSIHQIKQLSSNMMNTDVDPIQGLWFNTNYYNNDINWLNKID